MEGHNRKSPFQGMKLRELKEARERVNQDLKDVQTILRDIETAIGNRVGEEIAAKRAYEKKAEGTIRVLIDGVEVVSNVPKRVSWDSEALEEILTDMEVEDPSFNPMEWVELTFNIPERKYKEMPTRLRKRVDNARTLKHGKETIKLEEPTND